MMIFFFLGGGVTLFPYHDLGGGPVENFQRK